MKIGCLTLLAFTALGQAKEWTSFELAQLKGLTRVAIVVEDLDSCGMAEGLSRQELSGRISSKLQVAGMSVSDSAPSYVYVDVHTDAGLGVAFYRLTLELRQPAYLPMNPAPTYGVVHVGAQCGAFPEGRYVDAIDNEVDKYVNQFVIGWLMANRER